MFKNIGIVLSTLCFLLPLIIVAFLFKESFEAISHFGIKKFLFDSSWYPSEGMVGLSAQIQGSLAVSILALIFALPSSLSFVFVNEFFVPQKLSSFFNLCVDTLSGIPSVIFGLWGLMKIVPLLSERFPPGACLLVGAIILAMMIFPGFVVGFRGLLQTFNQHYKMSAMSISLSPVHYFFNVFLISNLKGFISVSLLQFGRSLGETMAVLMVTGNVSQSPDSLFSPIRTLTANIALEMAYADGAHRSSLYMSGFILALVLLVCLLIAFFIRGEHD
jgi:phosphate transport system permease protein